MAGGRVRAALFPQVAALALCALAGCATVYNKADNKPWVPGSSPSMGAPSDVMHENSIVLTFSGGGLRASAFALGVLDALEDARTADGDLLDDVSLISSVSGSSLTSAYYGLYGRDGMKRFRDEVLLPGFESGMRLSLSPDNLLRMLHGGLNSREAFGDVLDKKVFHGATFADLYRRGRPDVRIHATDLYNRVPFPFLPDVFNVICSDIASYPIADAVAASMAVPLVFAPIVVRTFPGDCPPLPEGVENLRRSARQSQSLDSIAQSHATYRDSKVHYIKLADGGLTDNYAVSLITNLRIAYGTPYAPMTARDAVRVRRLLVMVVDASHAPSGDWIDHEEGPVGLDLALSATDAAVDTAAKLAVDEFDRMIDDWHKSVVAFRCGLTKEEAARLGAPAIWQCADVTFTLAHLSVRDLPSPYRERVQSIPTRLTLPKEQVDEAIEGARVGTLALPQLEVYRRDRYRAP
ncbi:MAG TPA: patatin-like phospholipase family protein [Usitatibacter sp.]|nr:patatin-like phospholipase family protein [Usitatibacter sp.]